MGTRDGSSDDTSPPPRGTTARAPLFTRRRVLAGLGVGFVGTAGFEYASFRGAFDHRSSRGPTATGRFAAFREAQRATPEDALFHVGHSTHVLSVGGVLFLTDPWFFDPAFGALRHHAGPASDPAEIEVDAILISHDHADHFDAQALDRMTKSTPCFVATKELAEKMKHLGFGEVTVLPTWERADVRGVELHAVTAIHDVPEVGFVLRAPRSDGAAFSVYFAGDSALHPDLPRIAEEFAPNVAILPVDGTRLRGDTLQVMRPEDAVEAAKILKSASLVPSHAEAQFYDPIAKYVLSENIEGANEKFASLMRTALPERTVLLPAPGDTVRL